jgi:ABC-type nitrate/sulfonate/bicarbonate transport system permease component
MSTPAPIMDRGPLARLRAGRPRSETGGMNRGMRPPLRLDAAAVWIAHRAGAIGSLVLLLLAWETAARAGIVTPFLLPPLSVVLGRVYEDIVTGELAVNLGLTLYRAVTGFVIAGVAGVALGIVMTRRPWVRWFFDPIISVAFPMPKIAFLPVFMLWLGLYDFSKISMVVFNAIFPVIAATMAAAEGVDRHLVWSARSLGASERQLLREIILPAALPQILNGLQVALPISMIVTIVTEMLMGGQGLGGAMIAASRFADSAGVFAGIVEIAVAGLCLVRGIAVLRRHLLIWHQEVQDPTTV